MQLSFESWLIQNSSSFLSSPHVSPFLAASGFTLPPNRFQDIFLAIHHNQNGGDLQNALTFDMMPLGSHDGD